ncbi:MAG: hypothetical protein LBJ01_06730 [Tannerella sp.]|jgi:hypothetical protein|nr:hypothetical protein [Tannerella sp.]
MSKILIVSKTKMANGYVCVGGIDMDKSISVRLLDVGGYPEMKEDCPYNVREVWEIEYTRHPRPLPHSEDIKVCDRRQIGALRQDLSMLDVLKKSNYGIYSGSIRNCFEGKLKCRDSGAFYISNDHIPNSSTCFWICDKSIVRSDYQGKIRYNYRDPSRRWGYNITFVGIDENPIQTIPQDSLVRLSLAHWWSPDDSDDEERCYLQLSGWY